MKRRPSYSRTAGTRPQSSVQKVTSQLPLSEVDPELYERVKEWSVEERLALASELERRAKLLRASIASAAPEAESFDQAKPAESDQLSPVSPVLGYFVPAAERETVSLKGQPGRTRKTGSGWLKVRLCESAVTGLRAMAQCYGTSIDQMVRWGLVMMWCEFERVVGMKDYEAAKLARWQRDAIALQLRAVNLAAMRVGFVTEKN